MKTLTQIFNILSKQQKRLVGTNYYTSLSSHSKEDNSFFAMCIRNNNEVIYYDTYDIGYHDLNERLDKLIAFISRLLIK